MIKKDKKILLSFDLEEFDIPEEYGQKISDWIKIRVSLRGLKKVTELLDKLNVTATFFVTANFAKHNRKLIKELAEKHEIASHGFCHSSFSLGDLKESKMFLEKIAGQEIRGLRIPKLMECGEREIVNAGYSYNSSMNPTFIPGRYNNFFKQRKANYSNKLFNIPISVTPIIRFPLFWLSFKNLPLRIYEFLSGITLSSDKYLNIFFHPWEFTNISSFNLPNYIKKDSGKKMLRKLEKYLIWLKSKGEFITFSEFQEDFV